MSTSLTSIKSSKRKETLRRQRSWLKCRCNSSRETYSKTTKKWGFNSKPNHWELLRLWSTQRMLLCFRRNSFLQWKGCSKMESSRAYQIKRIADTSVMTILLSESQLLMMKNCCAIQRLEATNSITLKSLRRITRLLNLLRELTTTMQSLGKIH